MGHFPEDFYHAKGAFAFLDLRLTGFCQFCLLPLLGFILLLALILFLILFIEPYIFLHSLPCSSSETMCVIANTICCCHGLVLGFMGLGLFHSKSRNRIFFFKLNCCLEGRVALESGSIFSAPFLFLWFKWLCIGVYGPSLPIILAISPLSHA